MSRPHISATLRQQVADWSHQRCCYCLTQVAVVGDALEIDHIIPLASGGATEESNLCLACSDCNAAKQAQTSATDPQSGQTVPLFHPRQQQWGKHFTWDETKTRIIGLTDVGRATVEALKLNRPLIVNARRRWVLVGWHPPV